MHLALVPPACRRWLHLALAVPGLLTLAVAQEARSTLATLCDDAAVVAQVKVLASRIVGGQQLVTCKPTMLLKGELEGSFTLAEPDVRSCGRALHGVLPGASYLAFLRHNSEGFALAVGSSRALEVVDPLLLAHLRTLLTGGPARRLGVLVDALESEHLRVRQDAATALLRVRGLADPRARRKITAALAKSLDAEPRVAFDLIRVATRAAMRDAVDVLLPHYLGGRSPTLAPISRQAIAQLDPRRAVAFLERTMPPSKLGRTRAIALLDACGGSDAARCLSRLAAGPDRALATMAASVLTADTRQPRRRFRSILQY